MSCSFRKLNRKRMLQVATLTTALGGLLAAGPGASASDRPISARGQDVVIIEGRERTVYEYRQNNILRMIRVVPAVGRPYYLTPEDPTRHTGNLEHAEMLLPKWILFEF